MGRFDAVGARRDASHDARFCQRAAHSRERVDVADDDGTKRRVASVVSEWGKFREVNERFGPGRGNVVAAPEAEAAPEARRDD